MSGRFAVTICCLLVAPFAGCDWSSPGNMGHQPKAKTYDASPFFADGASARPAVAGTVARNGAKSFEATEDLAPIDAPIPFPITRDVLDRGELAYNVNCAVCHGRLGNGNGMVVRRGFSRPPSFHAQRLKDVSDAHIYNVITAGFGAMYSYGDRVAPQARWEIVAYVRALQAAPEVAGSTLTGADRALLAADQDPNRPKGSGGPQ